MERRRCGTTALELPVLGVGCWAFGGGDYWGAQDQQDVEAVVHLALEIGSNYFDTAEAYNNGASESSLGQVLKGIRNRAIIGTKVSPDHTKPEVLRAHCEASLKQLQTDYIDLYMIHWPIEPCAIRVLSNNETLINNPPNVGDAFATLVKLREEGKIRHIGVSNFGVRQLEEARSTGAEIVVNQLAYSLLTRAIEMEILPYCRQNQIGIIGYMPLMQGLLTGKYKSADEIPPARVRTRHFSGDRPGSRHGEPGIEKKIFQAIEEIRRIAQTQGKSMGELAIGWTIANPAITCTLAGARNLAQLEANVRAVSSRLSPDVIEQLNMVTAEVLEKLGSNPDYFENSQMSRTR